MCLDSVSVSSGVGGHAGALSALSALFPLAALPASFAPSESVAARVWIPPRFSRGGGGGAWVMYAIDIPFLV